MSAGNKTVITLVGRTGDGKSTLGNEILKCLGRDNRPFEEVAAAEAGTRESTCVEAGDVTVVDNPGLMDPSGVVQDNENITTIVTKARQLGHLNMLVLVMNSQADRFDDGMQNALKLICDSFGRKSLNNLFVVYTKCLLKDDALLRRKTEQIMRMINGRCGTALTHLTYYAVENHAEMYRGLMGEENVTRLQADARTQLMDLLRAARAQPVCSTAQSQPAVYDHVRQLREEKAAHAESEAHAAEEAQRRREIEAREAKAEKEREREREAERKRGIERERERAEEKKRAEDVEKERAEERRRYGEAERKREAERQEEKRRFEDAEQRRQKEREEDRRRIEEAEKKRSSRGGLLRGVVGATVGWMVGGPVGAVVGLGSSKL